MGILHRKLLLYTATVLLADVLSGTSVSKHSVLQTDHQYAIVMVLKNGLANRLRALASGYILAQYLGRELYVNWVETSELNVTMTELFVGHEALQLRPYNNLPPPESTGLTWERHDWSPDVKEISASRSNFIVIDTGADFRHPDMSCEEYLAQKSTFYAQLQPAPSIMRRVQGFLSSVTTRMHSQDVPLMNIVGVHIRANVDAVVDYPNVPNLDFPTPLSFQEASPLDLFIQAMRTIGTHRPDAHFVLITNRHDIEEAALKQLGSNRVHVPPKESKRDRASKGAVEALVDWLILSKSSVIIGSFWNSFSDEAAVAGQIPKVMIRAGAYLIDRFWAVPGCGIGGHPSFNNPSGSISIDQTAPCPQIASAWGLRTVMGHPLSDTTCNHAGNLSNSSILHQNSAWISRSLSFQSLDVVWPANGAIFAQPESMGAVLIPIRFHGGMDKSHILEVDLSREAKSNISLQELDEVKVLTEIPGSHTLTVRVIGHDGQQIGHSITRYFEIIPAGYPYVMLPTNWDHRDLSAVNEHANPAVLQDQRPTITQRQLRILHIADASNQIDGYRNSIFALFRHTNQCRGGSSSCDMSSIVHEYLDLSCRPFSDAAGVGLDLEMTSTPFHRRCIRVPLEIMSRNEFVEQLALLSTVSSMESMDATVRNVLQPVASLFAEFDAVILTNGAKGKDDHLLELARLAGVPVRIMDIGAVGPQSLLVAMPPPRTLTAYFAPSHFAATHPILGNTAVPIYVVHPIVDETKLLSLPRNQRHRARRLYGWAQDAVIIGFAGRMTLQKGTGMFVRAASIVQTMKNIGNVIWVMIGDGQNKKDTENLAAQLEADIDFIGFVEAIEMPSLLAAIDIFVFPSLYEEAFGMVCVEAMYLGKVVVSFPVGGSGEYIIPEHNGLLVQEFTPGALAWNILRLITDNKLRGILSSHARQSAKKLFTPEISVNRYNDILRDLIKKQGNIDADPEPLCSGRTCLDGVESSGYSPGPATLQEDSDSSDNVLFPDPSISLANPSSPNARRPDLTLSIVK